MHFHIPIICRETHLYLQRPKIRKHFHYRLFDKSNIIEIHIFKNDLIPYKLKFNISEEKSFFFEKGCVIDNQIPCLFVSSRLVRLNFLLSSLASTFL